MAHAALIYEQRAASLLEHLHREYLDVGQRCGLTMFALTDTWRANQKRIRQSKFHNHKVNQDNARFLASLRGSDGSSASTIFIGGQIGLRGDAYTPEEALASGPAEQFHAFRWRHSPRRKSISFTRQHFLHSRRRKGSRRSWPTQACPMS